MVFHYCRWFFFFLLLLLLLLLLLFNVKFTQLLMVLKVGPSLAPGNNKLPREGERHSLFVFFSCLHLQHLSKEFLPRWFAVIVVCLSGWAIFSYRIVISSFSTTVLDRVHTTCLQCPTCIHCRYSNVGGLQPYCAGVHILSLPVLGSLIKFDLWFLGKIYYKGSNEGQCHCL